LITDTRKVEDLVLFGKDKKQLFANKLDKPLIANLSQPYVADRGFAKSSPGYMAKPRDGITNKS
jgi:hypothetical protein